MYKEGKGKTHRNLSPVHSAILKEISKGHIQLRELTRNVNKRLKKRYLESTISARVRDLRGQYERLTEWKRGRRYDYYIRKA